MRKAELITFINLFLLIIKANCQPDSLKNGAYRNSVDFNKNKPLYQSEFTFVKKYHEQIPELYLVKSINPKIQKKIINNVIWGIYYNHSFYLNAKKIGMTEGYIKISDLKIYNYFRGKPIMTLSQRARLNKSIFEWGLTGALLTSAEIEAENKDNIHYVLNIKSGIINLLSKEYMLRLLKLHGELLLNFQIENNNDSIEVFLKYLDLVNKAESSSN